MKKMLFFILLASIMPAFCDSIHVIDLLPLRESADTENPFMRELAEVQQKYNDAYVKEAELKANQNFLNEEALIYVQQSQALSELQDKYMGGEASHARPIRMLWNEDYSKEHRAIIEQYNQGLRALVLKYAPEVEKAKIDIESGMKAVRRKYREKIDMESAGMEIVR